MRSDKLRSLVAFNLIKELQKNPALLERFSVENICELALRDTQKDGPITEEQIGACHKLISILEAIKSEHLVPMNQIMARLQPGHKKAWVDLVSGDTKKLLEDDLLTKLLKEIKEKVIEASQKQVLNVLRRNHERFTDELSEILD